MYICSKNSVRESFLNNKNIITVYVNSKEHELYLLAIKNKIDVKVLSQNEFLAFLKKNGIEQSKSQGVVALVQDYKYSSLDELIEQAKNKEEGHYPFLLMLDGIEDPHNLGAILRICDASGIDGVIIGKNRSVKLNETVAKVSTGAIEYVKIAMVTNLTNTINSLKDKGYWIVGAEYEERSVSYYDMDYKMPICLVIGSEGYGISALVKKNCDYLIKVPMYGHVNPLNASTCAGVIAFEILRSRSK